MVQYCLGNTKRQNPTTYWLLLTTYCQVLTTYCIMVDRLLNCHVMAIDAKKYKEKCNYGVEAMRVSNAQEAYIIVNAQSCIWK